jgi:protocatechuate 3,4-dioxygenase alpha subunit
VSGEDRLTHVSRENRRTHVSGEDRLTHVSDEIPLVATASQTVGPFFSFGLTTNTALGRLAGPDTRGERIRLEIRLFDGAGVPVPDAMVEIWHADDAGAFLFGRLETNVAGVCAFETVYPSPAPDGREAAHVNLCIFMRGLLRPLYTRLYFAGDPLLETDVVLAAVPAERRVTLIAQPDETVPSSWVFDVHLQGDRETVYFDL